MYDWSHYESLCLEEKLEVEEEAYQYYIKINDFPDEELMKTIFYKAKKAFILEWFKNGYRHVKFKSIEK